MSRSLLKAEELMAQLNDLTAKSLESLNTNRALSKKLHDYHCKIMEEENTIDALTTTFENNNIYLQHLTSLNLRSELFDSQLESFDKNNKVTKMSANRASILESSLNWRTTETTFDNLCLEYEYLTEQLRIANDTANMEFIETHDYTIDHSVSNIDANRSITTSNEYDDTFNSNTTHDSLFSSGEGENSNTTVSSRGSDDLMNPAAFVNNSHRKKHIMKKDSFLQIPFSASIRQPIYQAHSSNLDSKFLKSFQIDSNNKKKRSSKPLTGSKFPTIEETQTPTEEKVMAFIEEQTTITNHDIQMAYDIEEAANTPTQNNQLFFGQETPVDKVDIEYLRYSKEISRRSSQFSESTDNTVKNNLMDIGEMKTSSPNVQPVHLEVPMCNDNKLVLSPHTSCSEYESNQSDQESGNNRNSLYSDNSYGDQEAEPFNLEEMLMAAANENLMDLTSEAKTDTGTSTQIYRSRSHESIFSMAPTLTLCSSSVNNNLTTQPATPTTMFSSSSILDQPLSAQESKNNIEIKNQTMKWLNISNNSTNSSISVKAPTAQVSDAVSTEAIPTSFASQSRYYSSSVNSKSRSSKDILNSVSTSDRINRLWLSSPFASAVRRSEPVNKHSPLSNHSISAARQTNPTADTVISSSGAASLPTIADDAKARTHTNPISITDTRKKNKKDTADTSALSSASLASSVHNINIDNTNQNSNKQWQSLVSQLIPNSSMVYTETGKFVGKPCSSTNFNNPYFLDPMIVASPSTRTNNRTDNNGNINNKPPSLFKKVGNSSDRLGSFNGSHSTLYLGNHGSKLVRHGGDSMSQSVLSSRVSHAALRDALHSSFI